MKRTVVPLPDRAPLGRGIPPASHQGHTVTEQPPEGNNERLPGTITVMRVFRCSCGDELVYPQD